MLLSVGLVTAMIVAGCGGSGGDTSSVSSIEKARPSISKAEFLKQANAACRKERAGLKQRIRTYQKLRSGRKPEAYADVVHFVFLPTIEEEIAEIEAVGTPEGEKERLRILLAAERSALDAVAVMPRVASIAIAERHFVKSGRMLKAYGLTACANGNGR